MTLNDLIQDPNFLQELDNNTVVLVTKDSESEGEYNYISANLGNLLAQLRDKAKADAAAHYAQLLEQAQIDANLTEEEQATLSLVKQKALEIYQANQE